MKFKSGEVYEGQWADNKPHGIGVLRLKDESAYEGGLFTTKSYIQICSLSEWKEKWRRGTYSWKSL